MRVNEVQTIKPILDPRIKMMSMARHLSPTIPQTVGVVQTNESGYNQAQTRYKLLTVFVTKNLNGRASDKDFTVFIDAIVQHYFNSITKL